MTNTLFNPKITMQKFLSFLIPIALFISACSDEKVTATDEYASIKSKFGTAIDPTNLANYATQTKPAYILKDNTTNNPITNSGATLGRVLFYDKNLSKDNTISCSSCHKREFAFGDSKIVSTGVNGVTGRHSMRLVNSRFANEQKFFWDERATSLENQTTQPIQDHKEMGFSGTNGDSNLASLIVRLEALPYYQELFKLTYGDSKITEARLQNALAQFVRSIQSFDSKYDAGRANAANDNAAFANFSALENQGKNLFLGAPQFNASGERTGGGAGCQGCHRAPEFDIDPNSRNNGVVGVAGSTTVDLTNTRSPSLRDLLNANGTLNSQAMHDGSLATLEAVINHYNAIPSIAGNANLDPKLRPQGQFQKLLLTQNEKDALVAFLKTLTGINIYTDKKWSDPFTP
jgi:cytochrome c peroxidase